LKFNWKWNSKARPIIRIFAFLASLLTLFIGGLALNERVGVDKFQYDSTFQFGISATVLGLILLIIAIRGRIFIKNWFD